MLDRNWRCDVGELDLVVADHQHVVFVEVKARASGWYGSPALAVGPAKQRRIRILSLRWLAEHPGHRGALRFDVVAITGTAIEVFESAF